MARALIIHPDPSRRLLLSGLLDGAGYEVDTVSQAEEGIRLLRGGGYELALTDLFAPGDEGLDVLAHAAGTSTAVVVLVEDEGRDTSGILAGGARAVLPAGLDRGLVLQALRAAVAGPDEAAPLARADGNVPAGPRVLIVDDMPASVTPARIFLERHGYRVTLSTRGDEALAQAWRDPPDLVLLDVMMPEMDGVEVCRRLREDPRTASVPVLMLTALGRRDHVLRAVEAGASDYLLKSDMRLDRLLAKVARALGPAAGASSAAPPAATGARDAPLERALVLRHGRPTVEQVVRQAARLAPLPPVTARLVELLEYPEPGTRDLAEVISGDPVLAARVIALANSSFYGTRQPATDVRGAVVKLGFGAVTRAAAALSLVAEAGRGPSWRGVTREGFWSHSMAVAVVTRALARTGGSPAPEQAFLLGLLHDLGTLALAVALPEAFADALEEASRRGRPPREVQREVLGLDQTQVGASLAREWHLPRSVQEVCARHESGDPALREASAPFRREVALVTAADLLARARGHLGGGDRLLEPVSSLAWAILGLSRRDVDRALEGVDDALREAHGYFGVGEAPRWVEPGSASPLSVLVADTGEPAILEEQALLAAGLRVVRSGLERLQAPPPDGAGCLVLPAAAVGPVGAVGPASAGGVSALASLPRVVVAHGTQTLEDPRGRILRYPLRTEALVEVVLEAVGGPAHGQRGGPVDTVV
ncbi:MAG: HDOD domain-containing protein [Planctomycetes bacterium]|nr:HDOD domain-containing protein [Planctomycetota bacterium]